MNSTLKSALCAVFLALALGVSFCFAGCDGTTLKVYQENSITQIARGNTLDITYESKGLKDGAKVELKVEGDATIEQNENGGKLTAKTNAKVGSEIKVWAESGKKKSNVLKIIVIDLAPTGVTLNPDSNKVQVGEGKRVGFYVGLTPTYATIRDYEVSITKINNATPTDENKNWAKIEEDDFVLGADAPVGTVFELTASIVGHSELKGTATITVVASVDMKSISADDITIDTVSDQNKTASVKAFDSNDNEVDTTLDMYTYVSSDENVAVVNADGAIVPKGHGTATITVTALGTDLTETFKVYVIAPPTSIELQNVSSLITRTSTFSYGKADALNLSLNGINANYTCSNAYTFDFAMLDDSGNVNGAIASQDIATVGANNAITFKQTGKVQITIKSNSTLNNKTTTEAQKTIVVNVNEGKNISTVAELKAYANNNETVVANMLADLYLTETENFGKDTDGQYSTLHLLGDRTINGNGYLISTQKLPLATSNAVGGDFLKFVKVDSATAFSVKIYDLSIIGCGSVAGAYSGDVEANKGSAVVGNNGKYINTYRRGLRIQGAEYGEVTGLETKGYVKDMEIKNVSVSGFDVAIRIDHAVDGYMSDIVVANCFSNGMEFSQNTLTLNNVTLGQVGAFGIEMTPDEMTNKTTTPSGTAGENYNETASLKLTGYINSTNYNNGASTPYMQGLSQSLGTSIPTLVDGLISAMVQTATSKITDDATKTATQTALTNVFNSCLKSEVTTSDGKTENMMNFYLLIYVDKTKITTYDGGNTEGKFATYTSNGADNMINVKQILTNLAGSVEYDGYKQYQYIQLDLETGASMMGNVGQVILVNQAYDPTYTPKTNA